MPFLNPVHSFEFIVHRLKTTDYELQTKNWRRRRGGFTLVEILISVVLIIAIISILFASSGTFISSRSVTLQSIATKIAAREMENLRKTDFASLPQSGQFSDPDLTKLPGGTATRTVSDYQSNPQIKQVQVEVNWQLNNAPKSLKLESLIYQYGI